MSPLNRQLPRGEDWLIRELAALRADRRRARSSSTATPVGRVTAATAAVTPAAAAAPAVRAEASAVLAPSAGADEAASAQAVLSTGDSSAVSALIVTDTLGPAETGPVHATTGPSWARRVLCLTTAEATTDGLDGTAQIRLLHTAGDPTDGTPWPESATVHVDPGATDRTDLLRTLTRLCTVAFPESLDPPVLHTRAQTVPGTARSGRLTATTTTVLIWTA